MGLKFNDATIYKSEKPDRDKKNFFVQLTKPVNVYRDHRTYKKEDYHFNKYQSNNYYPQQYPEQIQKRGFFSFIFGGGYKLIKGLFVFSFNIGKFSIFHIFRAKRIYMNVRTKEARIESLRKSHQDENNEIF